MLASIQKVISVEPIPDADRIEKIKVLGWDCVVKKGIFKPGDLCVYIQLDTLIPTFLLSDNFVDKDLVRLRTVKMKKQISQGLALSLDNFIFFPSEEHQDSLDIFGMGSLSSGNFGHYYRKPEEKLFQEVMEGDDVTDLLGIKKYEKTIPPELQGLFAGNFPSFISKTDEERIQSAPDTLKELQAYYISTKCDGTSATYFNFEGEFGVCSRNMKLKDGDNIYWKMARKYGIDRIPEGFAIQGEICGPNIQKNRLELSDHELFVFNVICIKPRTYLDYPEFIQFCKDFNFQTVPIFEKGENFNYTLEELLIKATGFYPNTKNRIEGIVVRSVPEMYSQSLRGRLSFKVLNNEYLLKDEE
jgi:hypothetical protein